MLMKIRPPFVFTAKNFFTMSIILFVFLCTDLCKGDMPNASLIPNKNVQSRVEKVDIVPMTRLLSVVRRFKEIAQVDYKEALALYADQEAKRQFVSLNDHIWVETAPEIGWSFFMSVAVHVVGNAQSEYPLVAFYNPFSDVFLITAWRMDGEIPRMIEAEVLMGDWVRVDSPSLSLVPSWLRTDMFKPAALGNSVAEAITAFERVFSAESDAYWRKGLLVLENQQLLADVNYPAASIMLDNSLANIDKFRTAGGSNHPRMASCRKMTLTSLRAASQGHIQRILASADKTLLETQTILMTLTPEWFETLVAVAAFSDSDSCLVYLSSMFDASSTLSFLFVEKENPLALERIDVIDYTGFYKNYNQVSEVDRNEGMQ